MSKYIGNIPVPNATQSRTRIVATSGQTTFTTSDSYTPGYIDVFLGGVKLDSSEFTATNGTTVVLASGANTGQIFESISYTTYNLDSTVASQTGNAGKYLTTDGTNTSWADVNTSEAAASFKLKSYTTTQRDALTDSEAGDIIFNTTTGVLEVYGGEGWYAPHAMSIDSVTGDITATVTSTLDFTSTGLSSTVDIRYYEGATLLATTSSVTVTNGAFSDTVPSAVYGQDADDVITIKVVSNGSELFAATKTVVALSTASGGTETTSGSYKIHTFTSSGTLTVPTGVNLSNVEYVVVAGGAGGGGYGGGGGAGGYRSSVVGESSGGGGSAESRISLASGTSYTVTVGAGGAGVTAGSYLDGTNGVNSSIIGGVISITSTGGGGGSGYEVTAAANGLSGGCGGGAGVNENSSVGSGGSGTSNQGYAGGNAVAGRGNTGAYPTAAGGGGAGAVGGNGGGKGATFAGNGGIGVESSIDGTATYRAGGGGGFLPGAYTGGSGGNGGGGDAGNHSANSGGETQAESGTANTGGGGGGGQSSSLDTGAGGSGIVIIRYAV